VPGDFVDLHSFFVKRIDHGVMAVTPCTVGVVPHDALHAISETQPHLTRVLGVNMAVVAAIHRQWIVSIGRQSALEHAAHLLCELFFRLQVIGLTEDYSFKLPLTQAEMADTLGLSTVHVNRILQELRAQGLIIWRGKRWSLRIGRACKRSPGSTRPSCAWSASHASRNVRPS
jgi:CRP-like cAMP-binding protein